MSETRPAGFTKAQYAHALTYPGDVRLVHVTIRHPVHRGRVTFSGILTAEGAEAIGEQFLATIAEQGDG